MSNVDDTVAELEEQGFEEVGVTEMGDTTTIDFTIPAPLPGLAARSIKSSLLIGADGEPRSFILRLPVAKSDDYPVAEVLRATEQAMAELRLPDDTSDTFFEQGNFSVLPHIQTATDDEDELPARGAVLARQFNEVVDTYLDALAAVRSA